MAIRILIVDDSVVIRQVLSQALSADADLKVVGTAGNGRIALEKIDQLKPELITLDVEMPGMGGLETLAAIRKLYPTLPVIMFSSFTERGSAKTLEALALGASDCCPKPENTGSPERSIAAIREQLIPKIKALSASHARAVAATALRRPAVPVSSQPHRRIGIVAIGASTGGPNALAKLLPAIPKHFPVPIVVVQHMPSTFTRLLAERLGSLSQISVREGLAGCKLVAGEAWIAPGNFHMAVKRQGLSCVLQLNQEPAENSCRPAVDVLFRSVAEAYGAEALAVVMTGMGADGVAGARLIRQRGGEVIVQDEASCVVWGMPGLVYASGETDGIYPLNELSEEIMRRVLRSRARQKSFAAVDPMALEPWAR